MVVVTLQENGRNEVVGRSTSRILEILVRVKVRNSSTMSFTLGPDGSGPCKNLYVLV